MSWIVQDCLQLTRGVGNAADGQTRGQHGSWEHMMLPKTERGGTAAGTAAGDCRRRERNRNRILRGTAAEQSGRAQRDRVRLRQWSERARRGHIERAGSPGGNRNATSDRNGRTYNGGESEAEMNRIRNRRTQVSAGELEGKARARYCSGSSRYHVRIARYSKCHQQHC